jgi:hypothetical protein
MHILQKRVLIATHLVIYLLKKCADDVQALAYNGKNKWKTIGSHHRLRKF